MVRTAFLTLPNRIQAAASTPYRRSQFELLDQLNSLFDSLPSNSRPTSPLLTLPDGLPSSSEPRTAPLRLLPDLLSAFERKRGIELLNPSEKEQLHQMVEALPPDMEDQPVGVEQVLSLLVGLGVTGMASSSSSSSEADEPPAAPAFSPIRTKRGESPTAARGMLRPDPGSYTPSDGSPIPRHRRNGSSASLSSLSSHPGALPSISSALLSPPPHFPLNTTSSTTPTSSPSNPTAAARRRSLMSTLSRTPSSSTPSKTLRKRRTIEDLSLLASQSSLTYLGSSLEGGPTGEGTSFSAKEVVKRVKEIVGAKTTGRDREIVGLGGGLVGLRWSQVRSVEGEWEKERTAAGGGGKGLVETVTGEKAFKGNVEFALRGILLGPLGWDVWLLQKALEGATTNDTLLIDLLISRSPSSLALLRAAYSHRPPSHSRTPSGSSSSLSSPAPSSSSTTRSLDVAVLSAFSSNVRLRKAWEVALQARWEDCPDQEEEGGEEGEVEEKVKEEREERRKKLFREDLDQLKVALRRGGNVEIVAKILLARSPSHLHALILEYRKSTAGHSSLSKAIKQCVPSGTLQKLFLHAVENAKNVGAGEGGKGEGAGWGFGVWRDAKSVERAVEVEKAGGKREELLWRLVRLHWDRPRFLAVQQAYKTKYRKLLVDRLTSALPAGALSELAISLVKSASLPEPTPSAQDEQRLAQQSSSRPASSRSRTSSTSSLASTPEDDRESFGDGSASGGEGSPKVQESSELEAEGEMSDPPSPRSPPGQLGEQSDFEFEMDEQEGAVGAGEDGDGPTPLSSSFSRGTSETPVAPDTPTLPQSAERSASADPAASGKGHAKSSSLSFRQRSAPLELVGHRPPSSAGGSADSSKLSSSLRHSRPMAPSRAKRRQSDNPDRSTRGESEEPLSPAAEGRDEFRSPTPSNGGRTSLSRSTSSSNAESLGSSQGSSRSAAIGMGNRSSSSTPDDSFFGSPPTSIDTTSFHATPLSPSQQDGKRSSASFFPGLTPPPASPPAFDLSSTSSLNFFQQSHSTSPDSSPEKYFTSLRRQGSTVSHLSSTSSGAGGSRPTSMFAGEGGLGLNDGSLFAGSPAHGREGSGGMVGGGGPEQVQQLLRHTNDLMKKLKDTEGRLQASASAYEEQVSDLESRLEEVRSELQLKRREEKELRSTEKEHLVQINSLEADIAKLTKSLERSREAYDSMKRNYTATCEEAERLRELVAETRRENRAAEEAMQNHGLQVQQFERDRDLLQQTINKLEEDLGVARRAEDSLDDQKQENLLLKETIDKLRFEIDEMRSAARKSQFLDHGVGPGSPAKSLAESLSKSLGREIANHMAAQEESDEESEGESTEGEGEDVDDIIVTTHRRIKKRSKKSSPSSEPIVTHVETSTTVCDVDVQTDTPPHRETDVQTDLSAVNLELVAAPAVEPEVIIVEPESPKKTEKELQADLAKGLGVDLDLVRQFVDASKSGKAAKLVADAASPPLASPRRSGRWRQRLPVAHAPSMLINAFPPSARPMVAHVLDSSLTFALYSVSLLLVGVVTGSHLFPLNHHHTIAPFRISYAPGDSMYNSLNFEGLGPSSSGNGLALEGIMHFVEHIVWSGVRTARRIPS
ncbi:hypothetical protein JCM8547_001601 [Rhodosporidiobolus lusitaniae]